jgi:triacylglycerol lipase
MEGVYYMDGVNLSLASLLIDCCIQTYEQYKQKGIFYAPDPFTIIRGFQATSFNDTNWFGFILESPHYVLVAFRGTKTDDEWINDLSVNQRPFSYVENSGKVHGGFLSIYESCRMTILETLRSLPHTKPLLVTGHSLGGALSTLLAIDTAHHLSFPNIIHYNFGAPKIGDKAFKTLFDERISINFRFVNLYDFIPLLPPNDLLKKKRDYHHVKGLFSFSIDKGKLMKNHRVFTYREAIQKMIHQDTKKETTD